MTRLRLPPHRARRWEVGDTPLARDFFAGRYAKVAAATFDAPAASFDDVDVAFAVGAWITAAYWFTASTSFANPAVTLARATTDTFSGIRPSDAPAFVAAQLIGAAAATGLFRWLDAPRRETS